LAPWNRKSSITSVPFPPPPDWEEDEEEEEELELEVDEELLEVDGGADVEELEEVLC
jgi:hypothetical protein